MGIGVKLNRGLVSPVGWKLLVAKSSSASNEIGHLQIEWNVGLDAGLGSLTLVASWNPVVFSDDLFVILPAASELEDAVVERWGVEWSLVALDTAVLEHIEVVVASFTLVVKLWNAEEVGVALAGDWQKLSWRSDYLEDGFWNKVDWLVALWDLVGGVVDRLVPAAASDGDALEFRNTRETTVCSFVEKRLDFRV